MKITRRNFRRGLTLIELTIAMTVGIGVAVMVLALVNQQLFFLKMFYNQNFLNEEAPMIGMHVGRMAGKADRFRLFGSVSNALTGTNPTLTDATVLSMYFRQPDGTFRQSILAYETTAGASALNYYVVPAATTTSLGPAQWSVSKRPSSVRFSVEQGILRMKITGPQQEEITYSGTMQQ